MTEPILSSLDAEECLIGALLLHEPDFSALELFSDEDVFYDHLKPVLKAVRELHLSGKAVAAATVLYVLEPILDSLEWRGDTGEVMLIELLNRRMLDPMCWSARACAGIIHAYADKRRTLKEAQDAAKLTFEEVMSRARTRYVGEM